MCRSGFTHSLRLYQLKKRTTKSGKRIIQVHLLRSMLVIAEGMSGSDTAEGPCEPVTCPNASRAGRVIKPVTQEFKDYGLVLIAEPQCHRDNVNALIQRLMLLRETIYHVQGQNSPQSVDLIIAGDINRHEQPWGGDEAGTTPQQGEAQPTIDLMQDFDLQSLLPRER